MNTHHGLITIVGLHGYGIDERQLQTLLLADDFDDDDIELITPRAPLDAPEGGYSWFDVSIGVDGSITVDHDGLDAAIAGLRSLLESMQETRSIGPLVLLGYSQGGGLATAAIPHVDDLVDAVIAIAGFVPGLTPPDLGSAAGLPVLLEFGSLDHAIGADDREAAMSWVAASGADVASHVEIAPHVISAAHRRNISTFLTGIRRQHIRGDAAAPPAPTTNQPKGTPS